MKIKETIKLLRRRLSWSQPQLAVFFGAHTQTVSKWERGKLEPTPYQMDILNHLIDITENPKYRQAIMTYPIGMLMGAGVVALTLTAKTLEKKNIVKKLLIRASA